MLSKTLVAVVALTACAWASGPFVIDTPANAAQCVPTLIVWSGGEAPFFMEILDASSGEAIEDFANLFGQSFTWSTNVLAGTPVDFSLTDATGSIAQSARFIVQSGNDDCTLA